MRLILIREPIITLLPLLSKMLTTDTHTNTSPPPHPKPPPLPVLRHDYVFVLLPVSRSVYVCAVSLSHASKSGSVMRFLSRNMLFCLRFFESTCNKSHNYLFPASLTRTYRNAFGQEGTNTTRWPWNGGSKQMTLLQFSHLLLKFRRVLPVS